MSTTYRFYIVLLCIKIEENYGLNTGFLWGQVFIKCDSIIDNAILFLIKTIDK